jgi:hypothetical protein
LGIGSNTAIFSLINSFLFKPLAIHNPEEMVQVYSRDTTKPEYRAFSYPNFFDLRAGNPALVDVAAHNLSMSGITEGDVTRRLFVDVVSSNYFATMGAPLFRGRAFTAEEEKPGAGQPVVIVSYSFWQKRGEPADLLGKTLRVNGLLHTVVGIAAEGFTGTTAIVSPDLYLPLGEYESVVNDFESRGRSLASRDHHMLIRGREAAPRSDGSLRRCATVTGSGSPGTGLSGGEQESDLHRAAAFASGRIHQPEQRR